MSFDVILCTVLPSMWRGKSEQQVCRLNHIRGVLNNRKDLCNNHDARVFDLSIGMDGNLEGPIKAFYHCDTVHPNTRGIIAVEDCLRQMLRDENIKPDHPDSIPHL